MKHLIGKAICHFKGHVWRRPRRSDDGAWFEGKPPAIRICDRCGIRREVKARKAKDND